MFARGDLLRYVPAAWRARGANCLVVSLGATAVPAGIAALLRPRLGAGGGALLREMLGRVDPATRYDHLGHRLLPSQGEDRCEGRLRRRAVLKDDLEG